MKDELALPQILTITVRYEDFTPEERFRATPQTPGGQVYPVGLHTPSGSEHHTPPGSPPHTPPGSPPHTPPSPALQTLQTPQSLEQINSDMPASLPMASWSLIFRYVGAHNLEENWTCSQCQPWWHKWYCEHCKLPVPPAWTNEKHFGQCGQGCGCCRFLMWEELGYCETCENLWILKVTCHEMRQALRSYDGR